MSEHGRIAGEFWNALDAGSGVIDVGDTVLCDGCSTDLTDDSRSGGYIFGNYGYGPCCADHMMEFITCCREEEFIKAHCPVGIPFAVWIRELRGPNAQIRVRALRGERDE